MQLPQRQSYFYLEGKYSHENRKARFFFDRHLCVRFSLQCFGWKKHLRRITGPAEQFLICGVPLYLHLFVHFSKSGGALGPPAPPPAWALLLFTLPAEPFLLLLGFGTLEKTLRDRVRSLLSMRSVLLGYRPNSSALGTAGSLVIIGFVIAWNFPALAALASFVNKRMLAFEKKKNSLTRQNGVDYSRSSSCGEYLLFSTSMKNVTEGGSFFAGCLSFCCLPLIPF